MAGGADASQTQVWQAGTTYGVANIVVGSDGNIYVGKVAGNEGNDPTTEGGVNWQVAGGVIKGADNAYHVLSVNHAGLLTLDGTQVWPQPTGDLMGISWSAEITYAAGDIVSGSDFNVYVSLVNDNTANDPTTDGGVNWKLVG